MKNWFNLTVLALGVFSLFIDHLYQDQYLKLWIINTADFSIVILSLYELVSSLKEAKYKSVFFKRNLISILFLAVYLIFFTLSKTLTFIGEDNPFKGYEGIIIFRNIFILLKIFSRFQRLSVFLQNIITHPSQTMVLSFLIVIIAGSLLLSMPFSSSDNKSLNFIDSLFTSTSAVCVTGLIVVDTASDFSFWGKIIIMTLIQIGGLGIMILSFSALFMFKRGISIENKLIISYMINEDDISNVAAAVKKITGLTILIEFSGAIILYLFFGKTGLSNTERVFFSVFHSISAFCNAGFALFSDSLESFQGNPGIILTISLLIIMGGLSFSVIFDIYEKLKNILFMKKHHIKVYKMKVNSKMVLRITLFLLLSGTFIIYYLEHSRSMAELSITEQYLSAFFQSVTLRTAGFNSISFSSLSAPVLLIMIIYMFIGGASGSTAGGIKINNLGVILSYLQSVKDNKKEITLYNQQISIESVVKALTVFVFGIFFVISGVIILSITEDQPILNLIFETVSAFGTVGLSTGITSDLSAFGKIIIILLMFLGRLGTLTIVASLSRSRSKQISYSYPEADISIG